MSIITTGGKITVMAATTIGQPVDKATNGYYQQEQFFCSQCPKTRLGCTWVVSSYLFRNKAIGFNYCRSQYWVALKNLIYIVYLLMYK